MSVVKAHELGHIMQTLPGRREADSNDLAELAPTIELIVMQDIIYKKMNNIPLEQEVKYPNSSDLNLGKIANTFRTIKEKHGFRSYEDVLLTDEAKQAIRDLLPKKTHDNNRQNRSNLANISGYIREYQR